MNQNKNWWECPKCKISIEPQFDTCWKCSFDNRPEDEKKRDEVKESGLSAKYQSLRLFQTLMWFGFFIFAASMLFGFLGTIANFSMGGEMIFYMSISAIVTLMISYYSTKMFSNIIDFLFDLDEKNNK